MLCNTQFSAQGSLSLVWLFQPQVRFSVLLTMPLQFPGPRIPLSALLPRPRGLPPTSLSKPSPTQCLPGALPDWLRLPNRMWLCLLYRASPMHAFSTARTLPCITKAACFSPDLPYPSSHTALVISSGNRNCRNALLCLASCLLHNQYLRKTTLKKKKDLLF